MPERESALIALFHVRLRPLYCKQLRASLSLSGLSEWALECFPPSPAPARHKGTSVVDNTEVATVFFPDSQGVSQTRFSMQVSFLFSPPFPYFRDLFFCCSSVWPLLRGQRQTLQPAKGLSGSMASFELGQKHTAAAPHCTSPLWKKKKKNQIKKSKTDSHIHSNSLFHRSLQWESVNIKEQTLFCTVGTVLTMTSSKVYHSSGCASMSNKMKILSGEDKSHNDECN